jgi:hypothetical protein
MILGRGRHIAGHKCLIVFFLFGRFLFSWKETQTSLTFVEEIYCSLYQINDREFLYVNLAGDQVKHVVINFDGYTIKTIYQEE